MYLTGKYTHFGYLMHKQEARVRSAFCGASGALMSAQSRDVARRSLRLYRGCICHSFPEMRKYWNAREVFGKLLSAGRI